MATQERTSPSTSTPAATADGDILQRLGHELSKHLDLRKIHGGTVGTKEKMLQDAHDEIVKLA